MELSKIFQRRQDVTTVLVGVGAALTATWLYRRWSYNSRYRLPAGPPGSWITGNYDIFDGNMESHKTLTNLRDTYGDICYMRLGIYDTVLLNSYDTVREALMETGDTFQDRPNMFMRRLMLGKEAMGVMNSNGAIWRQLRRFTITALRDLGMGKKKMEDFIQKEAEILVNQLDKYVDSEVDISIHVNSAISNIICHLIFNTHYEYDEEEFKYFNERFEMMFQNAGWPNMRTTFVPYLIPTMLLKGSEMSRLVKCVKEIHQQIKKKIDEHYENYDPDNIRDFIDMYIRFDKTDTSDREGVKWSKENLFACIFDIFLAGTETTNTTLKWAILYLIHHPDIQKKCRDEINQVVGNQLPMYSDRKRLPFVEATLLEIQRLASISVFTLRDTNKDIEFRGYTIPKGMLMLGNHYSANTDPKYFPEPHKFDPQRWLDEDGLFRVKNPPLNFGAGPRVCLGETLAKYELFLFFTMLIQRFEFSVVDQANPPSMIGSIGLTHMPQSYKVIMNHV